MNRGIKTMSWEYIEIPSSIGFSYIKVLKTLAISTPDNAK